MNFVFEDKIVNWQEGTMYFVDTAKLHYLFNTFDYPYWLVVNVDVNEQTVANVLRNVNV